MARSLAGVGVLAATLVVALTSTDAGAARAKALRSGQKFADYGAVGATTAGLTRSFVDNGLGFVKDQRTGLLWEKKDRSGGIHDKDNKYTWTTGTTLANGTAFTVLLSTLKTPPCFAGYCDWRLPTNRELATLVDYGTSKPATYAEFDDGCAAGCTILGCSCTGQTSYWSSSTLALPGTTNAWTVNFGTGGMSSADKLTAYGARAVRGGQ